MIAALSNKLLYFSKKASEEVQILISKIILQIQKTNKEAKIDLISKYIPLDP